MTKRRLKCLEHLPSEAEEKMGRDLRAARAAWAEELRGCLGDVRLKELAKDYAWARPRGWDANARLAASARLGWTSRALFDHARELGEDRVHRLARIAFQFIDDLVDYAHDAALLRFIEALDADLNAIARGPRGRFARLPHSERREAIWQQEIKPRLPPQFLTDYWWWDPLPDAEHMALIRARAKARKPPDPATFLRDLVAIFRGGGLGRRISLRWAQDDVIRNLGLDRVSPEWNAIWKRIDKDEQQQAGIEEEQLEAP